MPISTDSYASLEEADLYLSERSGGGDWPDFDEPARISALITASKLLNRLNWRGIVEDSSQPLKFPRTGLYKSPDTHQMERIPPGIPSVIKEATVELALHLARNPTVQDQLPTPSKLKLDGVLEMVSAAPAPVIPKHVLALVEPFRHMPGNHWFPM